MFTVNELDVRKEHSDYYASKYKILESAFQKSNIPVRKFFDGEEVKQFITDFITARPHIKKIAFSDGLTLYQLGLFDWAESQFKEENEYQINQPLKRTETGQFAAFGNQPPGRMNIPYEEWKELDFKFYTDLRESLLSDLLIISANAITLKGEIVSMDGIGNRVAGMIFGPLHVICIVGRNKIVKDADAAIERIHNVAAPLTYIRHNNKHWTNLQDLPCVEKGVCPRCSQPDSSCRNLVIVRGQIKKHKDRIHLVVVDQDLGF